MAHHLGEVMNPRYKALESITQVRSSPTKKVTDANPSDIFGIHVFNRSVVQRILPREISKNLLEAMEGQGKIKPEFADTIAVAMKEWAIGLGATHYTHLFQPLTGANAEKHDAFIDWSTPEKAIEKFTGKQLIQGEPDASSFPSGGLRSTYEARGYTGWDPTSPAFIWSGGDGMTLCIPSVFFSWTGCVLDSKIPLLRSDKAINDAVMRLLDFTGISAKYVISTLGCEQEYFVIDRAWRNLRPDLVMMGRTVFGACPPKGQELQDHYFASVKDRILSFMQDFELAALKLGIPLKTRHNEVAPAQYEVAPFFERSSTAIDHNILLMELMRQTAVKHHLSCLLHEKPFRELNGSGKHCNWSLATDTGINLLDPTDTPENNFHFLILMTAILNAVHEHSVLLRASIGSAANDYRLGGHEAPPSIISVYLGKELENVLANIESTGVHKRLPQDTAYKLGLSVIPDLAKDNTDRNRTSPFAFTGNKFEFRAVGSSSSPAFPITVLNAIVAESLNCMLDEIESIAGSKHDLLKSSLPVIQKYLRRSRNILFAGDNYSKQWVAEAKKRKLPMMEKSIDAFEAFKTKKTAKAFAGILTSEELQSRYDIAAEAYSHTLNIEAKLMIDMFRTQILPAAFKYQKNLATAYQATHEVLKSSKGLLHQQETLLLLTQHINAAIECAGILEQEREAAFGITNLGERGKAFCSRVLPKAEQLRNEVDFLEKHIDDTLWILPKYRELLFICE